jgi:signal transduction histidine kinase
MEQRRQIRKRYLLKKRFQLGLTLKVFIALLAVAFITGWTIYYSIWSTVLSEFGQEKLILVHRAITGKLILRLALIMVAIAIMSVFVSHRMAGPVFKFERTLRQLNQGERVDKIRLRRGDSFKELASEINDLIDKVSQN